MSARSSRLPSTRSMIRNLAAGAAYFATVFVLGFLLGTVRTLLLADAPGHARLLGVVIELPVMLAASWFSSWHLIRRLSIEPIRSARALMGGFAFVLMLGAELLLGVVLFGRSVEAHFALYRDVSHALGLAGQIGFGVIPLIQRNTYVPS